MTIEATRPARHRPHPGNPYYEVLHEARELPQRRQRDLLEALTLDLNATTEYQAVLTRDPAKTGSDDPLVTRIEVFTAPKSNPEDRTSTGTGTEIRLTAPLTEETMVFRRGYASTPSDLPRLAEDAAIDQIRQARTNSVQRLAVKTLHSDEQEQLATNLILGLDRDAQEAAFNLLRGSLEL